VEPKRVRRLRGIAAVRSLGRRGQAILGTVIAAALVATISPLDAGPAQAATAPPPITVTRAAFAAHANPGSEPDSIGCKIAGPATAPGQLALTHAMEAARAAGLNVGTEQRTDDGTSMLTYTISTTSSPATDGKPPKTWWMYITYLHPICGATAYFWYDFSANMTKDIVKAAAKGASKVSVYLSLLAAILAAVLPNSKISAIISVIAGIIGVAGMNLKKWYKLVKKYIIGNGKHSGFDAEVVETLLGNNYGGSAARTCPAGWWSLKCGSPDHLWPKEQI
jgi:hypothetical protein